MSYSGIVVRAQPASLTGLVKALADLPGIEVHQSDPATSRLILTLEAASVDDEIEGLRRVQRVPGVVSADLVYHRLQGGDEPAATSPSSPTPSAQQGDT